MVVVLDAAAFALLSLRFLMYLGRERTVDLPFARLSTADSVLVVIVREKEDVEEDEEGKVGGSVRLLEEGCVHDGLSVEDVLRGGTSSDQGCCLYPFLPPSGPL